MVDGDANSYWESVNSSFPQWCRSTWRGAHGRAGGAEAAAVVGVGQPDADPGRAGQHRWGASGR
ncbi:hypothetical protein NKG94_07310 [Micromonospora sp. M12]